MSAPRRPGLPPSTLKILLAEDTSALGKPVAALLEEQGHEVTYVSDGARALALSTEQHFDLLVLDVALPKVSGITIFERSCRERPDCRVILMSGYGTVPQAVSALRRSAVHYLAKPFHFDELRETVRHVADELRAGWAFSHGADKSSLEAIVGDSPIMSATKQRISAVATTDAPVMILGESGTGKELVARAIHRLSDRAAGPFVAANCAAYPDTLFASEMFGHERGAFTGADQRREGLFEAAAGGTLFLDEVTEIPRASQATLLRVLQEGTYQRLGSSVVARADVRILSATNAEVPAALASGQLREDLYYRLRVLEVIIPPLRERRGDLALLVGHFLQRFLPAGRPVPEIAPAVWARLHGHRFPGNVRELEHAMRQAAALCPESQRIQLAHLPADLAREPDAMAAQERGVRPLADALQAFERSYLQQTLERMGWKKGRAARALGISRKTLWEKLARYGLDPPAT